MPIDPDHPLADTYFLLAGEASARDIFRLAESPSEPVRAALEETAVLSTDSRLAAAAVKSLAAPEFLAAPESRATAADTLREALAAPWPSVRTAAAVALETYSDAESGQGDAIASAMLHLLAADASRLARRAALAWIFRSAAPATSDPTNTQTNTQTHTQTHTQTSVPTSAAATARGAAFRRAIALAAADPHWRIRKELFTQTLHWARCEASRAAVLQLLDDAGQHVIARRRASGVADCLRATWRHGGIEPLANPPGAATVFGSTAPIDDPDPAVAAWQLEQLASGAAAGALTAEAVARRFGASPPFAAAAAPYLIRNADAEAAAAMLDWLDEPRSWAAGAARDWLARLDSDRKEAVSRHALRGDATPRGLAWAVDQCDQAYPASEESGALLALCGRFSDQPPDVRAALARLAGRWREPRAAESLHHWIDDPDDNVAAAALDAAATRRLAVPLPQLERLLQRRSPAVLARAVPLLAATPQRDAALRNCGERLCDDPCYPVRRALAALLAPRPRDDRPESPATRRLLQRLHSDRHSLVRLAALNDARAAEVWPSWTAEPSWRVLEEVARRLRRRLDELAPPPPVTRRTQLQSPQSQSTRSQSTRSQSTRSQSTRSQSPQSQSVRLQSSQLPGELKATAASRIGATTESHSIDVAYRPLGPQQAEVSVSPLGLSGHYARTGDLFDLGIDAGINLLFWEPNYQALTARARRWTPARRNSLHWVAGTFEAQPRKIRADVERALRLLKIEQVRFFLLFWVRSWRRAPPAVVECLDRLRSEGKIGAGGLSTHSRVLAAEALAGGWNPVMVRHSAAHRGAETSVFPAASAANSGLITFNNTCYGRLLAPPAPDGAAPSFDAADCYRYSLSHSAVRVALTAPATAEQLRDNLAALRKPQLTDTALAALLERGRRVYQEDRAFRESIRNR